MQSIWVIVFLIAFQEFAICEGQEKPLYTIPNFSKQTLRQDFCAQQRLVEEGKIELKDALNGMDLRPVFFPYQLNAETGAIDELNPDIGVEILDALSLRAGFQWRNSFGVADTPTGNQTWTDVLCWASSTYDLVGEWALRDEKRVARGLLFSEPWADSSVIMVKKKNAEKNLTFFNFLRPFTFGLWGLIGFTLVATGLVYYLTDYVDNRRFEKKMNHTLPESIFNASWLFTGYSLYNPKSPATRLLVFSLSFLCLISVAAYTANLASFLVMEGTDKIIIDDINDVIKRDLSCCVDELMPAYDYMKKYHPGVKLVPIKDQKFSTEIYYALERSECDIVITYLNTFESSRRNVEINPNCDLEWVGRSIDDQMGYFPLMDSSKLCASLINSVLSFHMIEMKRDRTLYTILEDFYSKSRTKFCKHAKEENQDTQSIGVPNVLGIFVVYFALLLASILFALFKFYSDPHTKKTVSIRDDVLSSIMGEQSLKSRASIASDLSTPEECEENVRFELHKFQMGVSERDRRLKDSIKKMFDDYVKKFETNQNERIERLQNKNYESEDENEKKIV